MGHTIERTPDDAAKSSERHKSDTAFSPSLVADFKRLQHAIPYLIGLLLVGVILWLPYYASGIAIAPQENWTQQYAHPSLYGLSPATVRFKSQDGVQIAAWWEKPWSTPVAKGTVIIVHGPQGNKASVGALGGFLLQLGYAVLLPDLRAHGQSGGGYSTFGYYERQDVLAAIAWAKQHSNGRPVAVYGYSSGAVASLYAAAETSDLRALVADSAYLRIQDVQRREFDYTNKHADEMNLTATYRLRLWFFSRPVTGAVAQWVFRLRTGVPFDPPEADLLAAARRITKPSVLLMTAEKDPVAPMEETRRILAATGTSDKQLVVQPGEAHSAFVGNRRRFAVVLAGFLKRTLDGTASQ